MSTQTSGWSLTHHEHREAPLRAHELQLRGVGGGEQWAVKPGQAESAGSGSGSGQPGFRRGCGQSRGSLLGLPSRGLSWREENATARALRFPCLVVNTVESSLTSCLKVGWESVSKGLGHWVAARRTQAVQSVLSPAGPVSVGWLRRVRGGL